MDSLLTYNNFFYDLRRTLNIGQAKCSSDFGTCMMDLTNLRVFDQWEYYEKGLYIYTSAECRGREKIAAYDLDKTLIKAKSGVDCYRDYNDWQLLCPEVTEKLRQNYDNGFKIVVFTNQLGLSVANVSPENFKLKIEKIVETIGVPMQVFIAIGHSIYRKPRTGMWDFLVGQKNDGAPVIKENSFYVGDAAGRSGDASSVDRLLALNLDLAFYTPEENFLGRNREPYADPIFDPRSVMKNTLLYYPPEAKLVSEEQELVVMVGSPGSGKTHFLKRHLPGYVRVNAGDWLKADEALVRGKSVVIDSSNADKLARRRCLLMAQKLQLKTRCFVMDLDSTHVKHNNEFRMLTDPAHCAIDYVEVRSFAANFTMPSVDEGFSEILGVKFVPDFQCDEDRRLYEIYLLGK